MCFNDKGKKVQEFHFFSSSYVHDVDISGRADARSFVYEDIKPL